MCQMKIKQLNSLLFNSLLVDISKELGIEIVGDAKIKIAVSNNEDDYDLIVDEDSINNEIDKEVDVEYLKDKDVK